MYLHSLDIKVSKMTEEFIYNILSIVDHNGDLMSFVSKGYEFSQITTFFDNLQAQDMMCFNQGILVVTQKGRDFMQDYEKIHKLKPDSKWLLRQDFFWRDPLPLDAIYIP